MQSVNVEGYLSELIPAISGVPQGTVLGPLLFLIHIRNIGRNLSTGTSSSSFADNTKVWKGVKSYEDCQQLQNDMESIYSWAGYIDMSFNSEKFEWIRYTLQTFQYLSPDLTQNKMRDNIKRPSIRLSADLSFGLHMYKAIMSASQMMVGL